MTTHAITLDESAILICQSSVRTEHLILLYMRAVVLSHIFMLYILTYFNMNVLHRIFNIILKISF